MNIFDLMRQSRNAALYRILYQQRMNAQCVGGTGEDSPTPPSPDPEPTPDPEPEPEPTPEPDVVVETQEALKEAFEEVEDGGLIQLAANINVSGEPLIIPEGKTVTVDLNGMTINSDGLAGTYTSDAIFAIRRGGALILDDTSTDKSGTVDGTNATSICCALKLTEYRESKSGDPAKVIINGGTYIGNEYGISGNGNRQDTDVTINGGKFIANGKYDKNGKLVDGQAVYQPQRGNLTINGGEFNGTVAVYVKCGTVTVNGGTFKGTAPYAEFNHNGNGTYPTGDAFVVEACSYPGGYPTVTVNGGTFISDHAKAIASYAQDGHSDHRPTKFITGGTFNTEVDVELIADGYVQEQVDGKYVVKKA